MCVFAAFSSTKPALLELLLFQRRFRRNGSIARLQEKRGYPLKDSLSFLSTNEYYVEKNQAERKTHKYG